jgi:YD repeat-containing protein
VPIATSYQYDAGDRLSKVTAGEQIRTFDYDGAGLLKKETHPESAPTTYEYDARGHVTKRITGASVLTFEYDSAERLRYVYMHPGCGTASQTLMKEFAFGSAGTEKGRLRVAKRYNCVDALGGNGIATVTETFSYDSTGFQSSKETAVGLPGDTLKTFVDAYTYDALGSLKTVSYPACDRCDVEEPRTVVNLYDHGYLRGVEGYAADVKYHPNGLWAELKRPKVVPTMIAVKEVQTLGAIPMPRPESRSLTDYCTGLSVTVPPSRNVAYNEYSGLSATAPAGSSFQWYSGTDTMVAGATGSTLNVRVTQTTSFWVRVSRGGCSVDSDVVELTVSCGAASISAPATINLRASGTASVTESGTYAWTIAKGSITGSSSAQSVNFVAGCAGSVTLTVLFTPSCGANAVQKSTVIPIYVPVVQLTATPSEIQQGSSSTLATTVSGTGPWAIEWSDAAPNSATRIVSPDATTSYHIQQVNGCPGNPLWASATVTVSAPPPAAPLTTVATKTGGGSVLVTWTMPVGAVIDSYRIERCTSSCVAGGAWSLVGTTTGMTFTDSGVSAGMAYVYRVFSVKSGTVSTSAGPVDYASTFAFVDDPLQIQGLQSSMHIAQLRSAVNALRAAAGLNVYSYTDTIGAGLLVKAQYLLELRTAVNQARAQFGVGGVTFTEPAPAPLGLPLAAHVNELRGGVQ